MAEQDNKDLRETVYLNKLLEDSINAQKKAEGDFLSQRKDSVNLLRQINRDLAKSTLEYEKILLGSSNTKDIQKEIVNLTAKKNILDKQASTFSIETIKNTELLSNLSKQVVALEREKLEAQVKGLDFDERSLNNKIAEATLALQDLGIEGEKYIVYKQQQNALSEQLKLQENALSISNKRNEALGISGTILGSITKQLGIQSNVFDRMNEKANVFAITSDKITSKQKWDVFTTGLKTIGTSIVKSFGDVLVQTLAIIASLNTVGNLSRSFGNALAGASKHSESTIRNLTSGISSIAKNIPIVGGLVSGLIDGFSAIFDLVLGIDNYITKAGRSLSISREEATKMYHSFSSSEKSLGNIYVTAEKMLESQIELSNQLGVANTLSQEILATDIKLRDFASLEANSRAAIAESSILTKTSSEDTVKSIIGQVTALKNATGIGFQYQAIIKEAANLGGYLGLQFAKYPSQLTNSLLITKALGTSLKEMDSIASSFLDFESSISKEFEAQVLTGRELNLNRARELFLYNDLAGAAQEINKQIGSSEDFLRLNRIAAESLAESFGMSRDNMAEMLKTQEKLSILGAKNTATATEQLQIALKRFETEENINRVLGDGAYQSLVNASTQEKLALGIEKIKASLVEFISKTGFIEKIETLLNTLSNPQKMEAIIGKLLTVTGGLLKGMVSLAEFFSFGQAFKEEDQAAIEASIDNAIKSFSPAANISQTKQSIEKKAATREANKLITIQPTTQNNVTNTPITVHSVVYLDGQEVGKGVSIGNEKNSMSDMTSRNLHSKNTIA